MYQPWTGGNMDEGWTRWVLEHYEFNLTSIHNADVRAGKLRQKFDAIIVADQNPRDILDGYDAPAIRPEYRGGIGEEGLNNLKQFVADGGTLVTMGNACDLAIEKLPIPVRNLKKGLTRDQHFAPRRHPPARGRRPASARLRRRLRRPTASTSTARSSRSSKGSRRRKPASWRAIPTPTSSPRDG